VGDERAETYLRLRAEAELRRVRAELRRADAAAGAAPADPGTMPFGAAEMAQWEVLRAGRILVAAGVLDQDYLDRFSGELSVAIKVRSRLLLDWDRRRRSVLYHSSYAPPVSRPPVSPPPPGASQAMQVAPLGGALRGAGDRVPWTLHLMSLVRTPAQAVITVAMRMHWPPDGSSADLEHTGAGPHHMPYDQLWAADDQGTRYSVRLEGGPGETATWFGVARGPREGPVPGEIAAVLTETPPLSQPLAPAPGTAEIIVTGTTARARATISTGGSAGLRLTCMRASGGAGDDGTARPGSRGP
jgi:hypothetical protein